MQKWSSIRKCNYRLYFSLFLGQIVFYSSSNYKIAVVVPVFIILFSCIHDYICFSFLCEVCFSFATLYVLQIKQITSLRFR